MNRREDLKALALAVNDGLTAYIATHNAIFQEQATFKSFLKNLFGLGVPMDKLLAEAERLVPVWDAIHESLEEFRGSAYSSLSDDERHYFDLLSSYEMAVRRTVAALVDRQRLMSTGAMGGRNNPMTWEALQAKERAYERAVHEYKTIGQELNDANPIVFG